MATGNSSLRLGSPVWLVLVGILSVQFGAGVAKSLFDEVAPTTIVWLRLATSALVLGVLVRPSTRRKSRTDWLVAFGLGAALAVMNWAIYQSFQRIPLGVAVTLEFIGPLTLAVVGSRRPRDLVWVALATTGVAVLGLSGRSGSLSLAGALFALLAGAMWASYILLSGATGRRWPGLDGLVVASVFATLLLSPTAVVTGGDDLLDPRILLLGALVGLLSSVIPYSCEMIALRTIRPSVFSILMSLEPAAATLVGMLVLREFLTAEQWLAMVCIVAASVGATRSARTVAPAPD